MKEIVLSQGKNAIVEDEDFENVAGHKWTLQRGRRTLYAYRFEKANGKKIKTYLHRELMGAKKGESVDHIDGDGLNCVKSNMRKCSAQQNSFNQGPRGGSSKFKGVSLSKKRGAWEAYIHIGYQKKRLGHFVAETQAAAAYDAAARLFFGKFAQVNFT